MNKERKREEKRKRKEKKREKTKTGMMRVVRLPHLGMYSPHQIGCRGTSLAVQVRSRGSMDGACKQY